METLTQQSSADLFKPKMRFPGSGGAPGFMAFSQDTIPTMRGLDFDLQL